MLARAARTARRAYRGVGEPAIADPGSLTAFLVERYRLYTADAAGRLWLTDIHHAPWRVRAAEAELREATLVPPGLEIAGEAPLLHLAEPQHPVSWLAASAGPGVTTPETPLGARPKRTECGGPGAEP